ncbi:MAG: TetR/AcrR family transcriptional regulator [Nocardioides sp.]|nr:TetR/AcrR family transcriptional regulator [Nocardioides sp.]
MSTARERARAELTTDILRTARAQLGQVGPASLSLRAVARDLGMVSSAVYRYVASRDELLTALIVQCYDELGATVEEADAALPRLEVRRRWRTACGRIRSWAAEHPHEYALLYGSPVPGYQAPQATIGPATRPAGVLIRIVVDAQLGEPATRIATGRTMTAEHHDNLAGARAFIAEDHRQLTGTAPPCELADDMVMRILSSWTTVFGAVSFELFGHLVGSVVDTDLFFGELVERLADDLDLPG